MFLNPPGRNWPAHLTTRTTQADSEMDNERLLKILEGFRGCNVALVGDFYLDQYVHVSNLAISPEMPVMRVVESHREWAPGAAGNVAVNLAALGARVAAFGLIGADGPAEILEQQLRAYDIDCRNLMRLPSRPTGTFTRIIAAGPAGSQHHLLRLDREAASPPANSEVARLLESLEPDIGAFDAVFIADYDETPTRSGVCGPQLVPRILDAAKAKRVLTAASSRRYLHEYSGLDQAFCNVHELATLGFDPSLGLEEFCLAECQKRRLGGIAVTLGEKGAFCVSKGEGFHMDAQSVQAVDTCGAGDSFAAAYLLSLLSRATPKEAARLATANASLAVTKPGTLPVHQHELTREVGGFANRLQKKILSREELLHELGKLKESHKKIVFTNGCFDILHPGHLHLLGRAKELGDVLVVGLNSDRSTAANKGQGRPILSQEARTQILAAVESVDYLTIFDELTPIALIRAIKPDVLVKGGNYRPEEVVGKDIVEAEGGRVVVLSKWGSFATADIIRSIKVASDGMREE